MGKIRVNTFIVSTCLLIGVIGVCITGTVKGQSDEETRALENWYREKEVEFLQDTRDYLNRNGFSNSGVTLGRVVDEEGNREYTFQIHHGRIDRMDEREQAALRAKLLEEVKYDLPMAESCSFRYEFLVLANNRSSITK